MYKLNKGHSENVWEDQFGVKWVRMPFYRWACGTVAILGMVAGLIIGLAIR